MKQFCVNGHDTFVVGRDSHRTCKACVRINLHMWYERNSKRVKIAARTWDKLNHHRLIENKHSWKLENLGKVAQDRIKHKTNRNLRIPRFGQDDIESFYQNCPEGYEVDHVIPLQGKSVSGLHVIWNLQYLKIRDNRTKGNKF